MPFPFTHTVLTSIRRASLHRILLSCIGSTSPFRTKGVCCLHFTHHLHCPYISSSKKVCPIMTSRTYYHHPPFSTEVITLLQPAQRISIIDALRTKKQHWKLFVLNHPITFYPINIEIASFSTESSLKFSHQLL